jgi:hypothetical protein
MKDIAAVLLASLLVLVSLISLISAERAKDTSNTEERISDLRFRYALKR